MSDRRLQEYRIRFQVTAEHNAGNVSISLHVTENVPKTVFAKQLPEKPD